MKDPIIWADWQRGWQKLVTPRPEQMWTEVKRQLRLFAEQKGEQELVPAEDAIPLLREAMRSLLPRASPSPASR